MNALQCRRNGSRTNHGNSNKAKRLPRILIQMLGCHTKVGIENFGSPKWQAQQDSNPTLRPSQCSKGLNKFERIQL